MYRLVTYISINDNIHGIIFLYVTIVINMTDITCNDLAKIDKISNLIDYRREFYDSNLFVTSSIERKERSHLSG